jgi:hypothetical protein
VKTFTKSIIAALVVASSTAVAATSFADIVCNSTDNVCWHVRHHHYTYKPEFGVVVHPDNWAWGPNDHYKWREHTGRGYWRGGVWIGF